jgi:hypothetical protein
MIFITFQYIKSNEKSQVSTYTEIFHFQYTENMVDTRSPDFMVDIRSPDYDRLWKLTKMFEYASNIYSTRYHSVKMLASYEEIILTIRWIVVFRQ